MLRSFRDIERAVAQLIEPAALARYRANTIALDNQAVFEIPAMLEKIFEESSAQTPAANGALLAGKTCLISLVFRIFAAHEELATKWRPLRLIVVSTQFRGSTKASWCG